MKTQRTPIRTVEYVCVLSPDYRKNHYIKIVINSLNGGYEK
jgi:hypothetical protein